MTQNAPLFWIKQLQHSLEDLKEIPLWGTAPSFPLDQLAHQLGALLHIPDLKITLENVGMRSAEELTAGLGSNPAKTALELTPLSTPLYLVIATEDMAKLIHVCLATQNGVKGFSTPAFQEGFYRFLLLQVAELVDQLNAFDELSIKIGPEYPLPKEPTLCLDVCLHGPKQPIWARLVLPSAFRQAFKSHFSTRAFSPLGSSMTQHIDVPLKLEVGQTRLTLNDWKQVTVGDFVVLEQCSFDPKTRKGTATLVLNQKPLLRVRLKEESLKIVDYAFYYEDTMNENTPEEPSDDNEELLPSSEHESNEEEPLWISEDQEGYPLERLTATHEIQLSLTVEVARLKMNLDKLLQLKPGNILEIPVRPEQGVDISIAGKKVAKGELIKLGEMLGVKILHLGE